MQRIAAVAAVAFAFAFALPPTTSAAPRTDYVTRGLLCIHHYEGSWTDPGAPYWGGLQMDIGFMATYGAAYLRRWGTADRWPVWAQLAAGRRGYMARGWSPWPNTSRMCGLR